MCFPTSGGIAQLGERLNGIQEVSGSIPLISTITESVKKTSLLWKWGFALCCDCRNVQSSAELLKVNIEIDMQPIVPIHLHAPDQAAHDHFL